MKVTYNANALVQEVDIEGVIFRAGETHDVPDDKAEVILRNANFTDERGHNAYSQPDVRSAPASVQIHPPPHPQPTP